jgi:hypothetical protein
LDGVRAKLARSLEAGSSSSVGSVVCGTTLCRAEMSHADQSTLERYADAFLATSPGNFHLFFERKGDALATTLFITREGQQIPNFAQELAVRRDGKSSEIE